MSNPKMKVEIWSDVMCPFCYIGKRKFEEALERFPARESVEVAWRSYQLDPEMRTRPGRSINEYLAERKGWSLEQARSMNARVTEMARAVGLEYDFDRAVVANSFDAHRLVQLARTRGLDDALEEALFKAYFTDGADIADFETLVRLGVEAGLEADEVRRVLGSDTFAEEVRRDNREAYQVGAQGVPFFVLDRKYAVSGAQDSRVFLQALEKAFGEWQATKATKSPVESKELQ